MLPLLFLPIGRADGRPQIFAHPAAGESVTKAAATQSPLTAAAGRAPAAAVTTFDNGQYTWRPAATTVVNAKTLATNLVDDSPDDLPATTSTARARPAVTRTATTSSIQAILATPSTVLPVTIRSSLTSDAALPPIATSTSQTITSRTSSVELLISASSANDASNANASNASSPSTQSVVVPLVCIGVVILLALIGGIAWSRKKQIKRWWSGHRESSDWDEKRDDYQDASFDPYTARHGGNWPLGGEDFAGDDRYGPVSSRMRQTPSAQYEETGHERGWLWGTRRASDNSMMQQDRDLLAHHDQYDAMLAQSRTGYLPSEAHASRLNRQPSYFARAGQALVSSLSSSRRSRRVARLSSTSATARGGAWDEHGSWRPLQDQAEEPLPKRLPATPPSKLMQFSGIHQESVRKPLIAASPEGSLSRSEKRWHLSDAPIASPSPSPTKRVVPSSLRTGQGAASSPVTSRYAPELFYSPSPVRRAQPSQFAASQHGLPSLVFSSNGPPVPNKSEIVYTEMPPRRAPSPAKAYGGQRPPSRVSQRSGSLTDLVTRVLLDDETEE